VDGAGKSLHRRQPQTTASEGEPNWCPQHGCGYRSTGLQRRRRPRNRRQLYDRSVVAVDTEGNLFIADASRNRIRKVRPDGIINSVARDRGSGLRRRRRPGLLGRTRKSSDVAVDAVGNLFIIVDYRRIRQVTPAGVISRWRVDTSRLRWRRGPAVFAYLRYPSDVAGDGTGNLPHCRHLQQPHPEGKPSWYH
jgi:hypothetical protein